MLSFNKKMWFAFLFCIANTSFTYTLPADFILSEMAKNLEVTSTPLKASVEKNHDVSTSEIKWEGDELHISRDDETKKRSISDLISSKKKSLADLTMSLRNKGVDTSVVNHGLHEHEPVFIIGAANAHQIWIDKASFLPLKEISNNRTISFQWSTLLKEPQKKFPSVITISSADGVETFSISEKTN